MTRLWKTASGVIVSSFTEPINGRVECFREDTGGRHGMLVVERLTPIASCRFCGCHKAHALVVSSGVPNSWTTRSPHGLWVCRSIPACERRQQQNGYDPIRVKGKR